MNNKKVVGLIAITVGASLFLIYQGDATGMVAGLLCGLGLGLVLTKR